MTDLKRAVTDTDCNPFIKLILTRCIHCTRCIRFLREIAGNYSLGMLGRGQLSEIGLYTKNILVSELSSNIIDFCPVGALTNKTFALNYRNWESCYVDSIDIMDSFLGSVRIYHDNFKIKRILSNYNDLFNAYWINDKSRYFFDSLKLQRLIYPLILKKKKLFKQSLNNFMSFYISTSWKNISLYLNDYINININKLMFKSFLGDFIDLESIINFRYLTYKFGSDLLINKSEISTFDIDYNSLNFDNEINYIHEMKYLFTEYDLYIFYNYNLRIENPVFNSKLRQKVIWFNFNNIYFFGSNYNMTYKYYHLSNSHLEFIKFIFGRHWLCNILFKFEKICFIYGNYIFQDFFIKKSWLFYLEKLKLLKKKLILNKKEFFIFYLSSSITTIASFDLNFFSRINQLELNNKNVINYFIGMNEFIYNHNFNLTKYNIFKNNFYIYQNSFYDIYYNFCNIILPVFNCFELENQFFINTIGLIKQNIKLEVNFEEFIKTNIDSLKFIFKSFYSLKKINSLVKLNDLLPVNCLLKVRKIFKFIFNMDLLYKNFSLIKYKNFYLISLNKNFYKSNIYCFYSKQLNMMSYLFFKNKSNFDL